MYYPDCMVDIETTGTQPDRTGILQIAAVRFNLREMSIDTNVFEACLYLPPHRMWDEGTRQWWSQQNPAILEDIIVRGRNPGEVMNELFDWARDGVDMRFWSKPLSFDFPFIQSYFKDYELTMPFHYRKARDVNTFIEAIHLPDDPPLIAVTIEGAHNALNDAFGQIEMLFRHYEASIQA